MNLFNHWIIWIGLYLLFAVSFDQNYKLVTKSMKKTGALTVLIEILAAISSLLLIPFFHIKFSTNPKTYLFLGIAIIFYTINNRLSTIARSGIEASSYSMLKQLSNVFIIIGGLLLFKEPFVWHKMLGTFLIIFSNIFVFYKQGTWLKNRYIIYGTMANLSLAGALLIDVAYSQEFNLAFYVFMTIFFPSILTVLFEKIKYKELVMEFYRSNRRHLILTSISWTMMMISKLRAYQLGAVTVVASLCSLTVILNVIVSYIFLKERSHLIKKLLASIFIMIGLILIKV